MNWIKPIVKGLAWATVPFKIINIGLDHAKNEIQVEIRHYESKVKILVLIGISLLLAICFGSIALGFLISAWCNSISIGFSVVAGFYFSLFLFFAIYHRKELYNLL